MSAILCEYLLKENLRLKYFTSVCVCFVVLCVCVCACACVCVCVCVLLSMICTFENVKLIV